MVGLLFILMIYELEEVVVTGSRISVKLPEVVRSITIITSDEIKELPVHSVAELLNYCAGVDIRQRALYGVQADPSIRGASFEQVLVLIDGVKVCDPQTGHHTLNLPITLDDIERIEILRGHSSSLYGANAFGGVINIITKEPRSVRTTGVGCSYGSYNTWASQLKVAPTLNNRADTWVCPYISLEYKKSDGYREDTDFDNLTFWSKTGIGNFDLSFGYQDKRFGAYGFYATDAPSWERTKTNFISIKIRSGSPVQAPTIVIEPTVYYREHYDKFVYIRKAPDIYTNYHTNYKYGSELLLLTSLGHLGKLAAGAEAGEEQIESWGIRKGAVTSALGYHKRQNAGLYIEHQIVGAIYELPLLINTGARADYNSQYRWNFSPSMSMGYIFSKFKLRASCGSAFRAPSFTELYYEDPKNIGNPNLLAETALAYEVGIDVGRASVTLFSRNEDNLIDWVRQDTSEPWQAKNIKKVHTKGAETEISLNLSKLARFTISYTFIDMEPEIEGKYISKYALNYPEHMFGIKIRQALPFVVVANVGTTFKKRVAEQGYWVSSIKLSRELGRASFFFEAMNLLDTKYEELPGIELPGRWITFGAQTEL